MSENKKHYWLYVLKLEQGKYYVGITAKTPQQRFLEHKNGYMAAQWTRKYKPLKIIDIKDLGYTEKSVSEAYENKVVRKYMKQFGHNNVRGGDLSYSEDYTKRFGYYISTKDWEPITVVILLLLAIAYLLIKQSWHPS